MVNYVGTLYHVGVRVVSISRPPWPNWSAALGITWASVVEREQPAWTPADGAFTTPLRFTYSCEGPQHVELLQGARRIAVGRCRRAGATPSRGLGRRRGAQRRNALSRRVGR